MENTNKTKGWLSFLIPPLILAVAVLSVHLSGNDKAPVLVFLAFGIIALVFVISGINNLMKSWTSSSSKFLFWGATLTLVYIVGVIFLSRAGLVDSIIFLGFR